VARLPKLFAVIRVRLPITGILISS
jgi:hypothetical protein